MGFLIQVLLDGVVFGALIALAGVGTVVIYRTTNVLNFAQAGVMATTGYLASAIHGETGQSWLVGLVAGGVLGAAIGGVLGCVLLLTANRATDMERSVATLGVAFVLAWLDRAMFGDKPALIGAPLGDLTAGPLHLGGSGIGLLAVSAIVITFVYLVVERTRAGLAMRALSQDAETARGYGVSRLAVTIISWTVGSGIAGMVGVLAGTHIQVDQATMLNVMVMALAGLVVGGFGTAPGAVVGGLTLGVAASLVTGYLDPAYKNTVLFGLVLAMLIVRPHGILGRARIRVSETTRSTFPSLPTRGLSFRPRTVLPVVLVGTGIAVLPFVPHPFPLTTWAVLLATAAAVLSIALLKYYADVISLGHGALATLGGYATAIMLRQSPRIPFVLDAAVAVLACAVVGAILAWLTLRMSGLYLAIATIIMVYVVSEALLGLESITGGATGLYLATPYLGFTTDIALTSYVLSALVFAVVALVAGLLLRSRLGRAVVAVRDAPRAAACAGISLHRTRVAIYTISAGMAGLSGASLSIVVSHIGPTDYGLLWSFMIIVGAVVGGGRLVVGALIGGAFITLVPAAFASTAGFSDGLFGLALLLFILVAPGGIVTLWERALTTVRAIRGPQAPATAPVLPKVASDA